MKHSYNLQGFWVEIVTRLAEQAGTEIGKKLVDFIDRLFDAADEYEAREEECGW